MSATTIKCQPIKASEDKRDYRSLQLANGLKVILISDPSTDKAAAALDVHVGHLSDPWEIPGLAHFLEHMLFLGTEKYPNENEYSQYLTLHGGGSNAYTDCDHTNFYFDVSPAHFDGALDRFAQFFLHPLFTESATDREVKAVNSENEKNLASDSWRAMQLERSLSKAGHAYGKFGTGSTETLENGTKNQGMDLRQELLDFHQKWYSANIMALAVLGSQTLDELESLVTQYFGDVKDKSVTAPSWPDHPFEGRKPSMVNIVPIKDLRLLQMSFPIPDYIKHHKSKPVSYISHLIGHEGKGSLLSELKSLGYVNNLCAGEKTGAKGFSFFIVDVDLTETGIEHIDDIILLVFQYLAMLRQHGIQEWIFEECKLINDMQFRFKDKERPQGYARILANWLHDYGLEDVLRGPWMFQEFNPDLIKDVLDRLVPQNVHVIATGRQFESMANLTEKWYGSKYSDAVISEDKLQVWSNAKLHERLFLPSPNEFIPSNYDLVPRDNGHDLGSTVPGIIKETELSRLWFLQDNEFLLPKACISLEFFSPLAYVDPHHSNLTSMFVSNFKDSLTEYKYDAELAGLDFSMSATKQGLSLDIRGYHEKQSVLLDKIISAMRSFKVDQDRFEVLKEAFVRALKNFEMEQPHSHATYRINCILGEKSWPKEELLQAAMRNSLSASALQAFIPQLLDRIKVEMFVHGNVTPNKAIDMLDMVEKRLGSETLPLPANIIARNRQLSVPSRDPRFFQVENSVHKSSCILVQLQIGLDSTAMNVKTELLSQIIKEPCFNILRTQEQLGYIVYSGVRSASGVYGLDFIVQSEKKPKFLDSRIENFILEARKLIQEMDDEEFERHKNALLVKKLEKPKKLSTRNERIWREICAHTFNFKRVEVEAEALKKVTRTDLLEFFDAHIGPEAPERRKLSTHVVSTVEKEEDSAENSQLCGQRITDVCEFKGCHPLHPLAQPFVSLSQLKREIK